MKESQKVLNRLDNLKIPDIAVTFNFYERITFIEAIISKIHIHNLSDQPIDSLDNQMKEVLNQSINLLFQIQSESQGNSTIFKLPRFLNYNLTPQQIQQQIVDLNDKLNNCMGDLLVFLNIQKDRSDSVLEVSILIKKYQMK